jgi:hypothetical protein
MLKNSMALALSNGAARLLQSNNPETNVKVIFGFSCCLLVPILAMVVPLSAQQERAPNATAPTVNQEQVNDANIQLMRQDIRAQRKKIVAANLPLTETEAMKFWPVYDRYIGETIKVNDVRYALIKEYAKNYQAMTDDQADSFIKRWLTLDQDNTELRLKFIPEFESVIPRKKTAMFFQIDRRVAMMIELQLSSEVPLVKP